VYIVSVDRKRCDSPNELEDSRASEFVKVSGIRSWGSGFRDSVFRVQGLGFRVQGLGN
jgi:hypothetical protein